jgi:hypothetical protein
MKKWQSSFWTVLTLVALFATTLPSLVWACPMTGQIGDAPQFARVQCRKRAFPLHSLVLTRIVAASRSHFPTITNATKLRGSRTKQTY